MWASYVSGLLVRPTEAMGRTAPVSSSISATIPPTPPAPRGVARSASNRPVRVNTTSRGEPGRSSPRNVRRTVPSGA